MNALSTVNASTFYFLNNIAVDISYGLTYYYTFDISTNNTNVNYLKNLATQVYDLSLVGTLVTSSPSPKYGLSSLYLTNSVVQPINPYNFLQTSGVTISFWTLFNITPTNTPILFFLGNISTNLGIGINNSNNLYYYINGSSYSTTNTVSITINTWTNITISLDSNNNLKLYKAGALVDQRSSVSIASASYPMYLGGGAPGSSVSGNIYLGYMDDFRLYNNCLNGRQILNISKFGGIADYSLPVDPVGLMSYYRFEPTDISLNTVSNFAGYLYNSTYNNLTSYTPIYDATFNIVNSSNIAGFTIPGLELWLDAGAYSNFSFSSSNSISTWKDRSGYNRNATKIPSNPNGYATYIQTGFNGLPGVQINTGQGLGAIIAANTFSTGLNIFAVFFFNVGTPQYDPFNRTYSNFPAPLDYDANTYTRRMIGPGNNSYVMSASTNDFSTSTFKSPVIYSCQISPTVFNEYVNGGSNFTFSYSSSSYSDASGTGIYISTRADSINNTSITISELVTFSGVLTTSQRQSIEGYLALKWNLQSSLPSDHPYKSTTLMVNIPNIQKNTMVSYNKYNTGYGTLDISNSNYLQIPYMPPLANNGVSFSFWMRSNNNNDSGYYPLFNFGNYQPYNTKDYVFRLVGSNNSVPTIDSTNTYSITNNSSVTMVNDSYNGWVFNFTGSNYLSISNLITTTTFTRTAWAYDISGNNGNIFSSSKIPLWYNLSTKINTQLNFLISNTSNYLVDNIERGTNSWVHYAITYDGITFILYVNGIKVSSQSYYTSFTGDNGTHLIGSYSGVNLNCWIGYLNDLREYSRALSPNEIQLIYNNSDKVSFNSDNIKFGLYNNKIVSSIQNGNTNALSFRLVTPPNDTVIVITNGGNNTILPNSSPGYLIGPATDASMFYASSVMMAGYNILYGTSPAIPLSGYIYPLTITSASAEWIATRSGDTYHQMVKATVTIVNGNAYVYSSEARYYTKSKYPSNYSTNVNSYASVIYAWNNSDASFLATTYNTPSGYAIYSINSIFFKNIANLLDSSTYTLSFTADTNTVYTGTYSRTNGDVITYSSLNNYWSNITLYNVAYINGIRISADGSKGAFITADTSLCYFFTKSGNTYSPAVGSNIASFTSTNIISTGYNLNLTGLDMSLDGSRIVVSSGAPQAGGTGGNIYYTDWNSIIKSYNSPFTQITNISSGDYRGVAISPDKNIIVYGVNTRNTVYYSLWSSYGNAYSIPYTLSSLIGPPANFKFTMDGSILYYSLNGNTSGSNLYYSVWNGNNFNGFTSVGANIVPSNGYTTGLGVLSNNTVYVYKYGGGGSGQGSSNVISYSITNNTTLTAGNLYTTPVNDNVWRHYAWTIDPSNQKYTYYVNGNVSSNVSGNSLTFPTAINNSGLVLYYPLQNNGYNYASGCPVNDAYSVFSQFALKWTNVGTTYSSLNNLNWSSISLSQTGQYQIATVFQGNVYLSNNYGSTWNIISTGSYSALNGLKWRSSAISGTGQYITIIAYNPSVVTIYNSVNYGTDWTNRSNSIQRGISISMSYSGQYQTIVGTGGFYSNNYGNTWTASTGVANDIATGICMSSSGQYQYSCGYYSNNRVVQSSDYGVSFNNNISLNGTQSAIATSSDGKYILVGGFTATFLSLSTDSARSWSSLGASNNLPNNVNWISLSISDSGQYMIATTKSNVDTNSTGYIYYSTNYGSLWANITSLSTKEWSKVCLSRDGKCITAITGVTANLNDGNNIYGNPGTIYTSRISIENSLSLPLVPKNINGYSFSFSFTPSSINQTGIIWSFNNATNISTNRIFMGLQNGNIQIGTGSTTFTSIIQPNANTSNLYVWTFTTSGTSNIYLNGNTTSFITTTTVPYYNSTNFNNNALFSDPVGGNVVAGTITEFRYYDRILSPNDVTQLYGNVVSRTQNIIGASNTLTSYFTGGIDEFQMYNRVLSSTEVSQLSTMGPYYNLQGAAASPITGLVANNLEGSISISYNASQNYVKGYNISFSPSITGSPFTTTLLTTNYTGFVNGTNYTANVYAVGVYGNSVISANTFIGIGIPTAPIITTATSSNTTSISITFTQSPGYINYYTANVVTGSTSISNVTIANTVSSANITGLNANTLYSINMVAVNPYGNSSPSSSSSSYTLPNPPTVSGVSSGNSSIIYTFSSINGNSFGGNVLDSSNSLFTTFNSVTSNPYTIGNLSANKLYTVKFYAINPAGNSTITSNTYYTLPNAPTFSSVTSGFNSITYTFSSVGGASYYNGNISGKTLLNITSPYTVRGLIGNSQYTINLYGNNSVGNSTITSNTYYTAQSTSYSFNNSNNLVFAFSVRLLVPTYTGAIFKVKRSSDGALQDFYTDFNQSYLTTGPNNTGSTYSNWIGSGTAYIDTWYNQSGNAQVNAVYNSRYSSSTQPIISYQKSKYVIYFNSNNDQLVFNNNYTGSSTIFAHFTCTNGTAGGTLISTNGDGGLRFFANSVYGSKSSIDWFYVQTGNLSDNNALSYINDISSTTISASEWNVLSLSTSSSSKFGLYVIGNPTGYARGLGGYVSEIFGHNAVTYMSTQDIDNYYNNVLF